MHEIQKQARKLLGKRAIRSDTPLVEMVIGISTDECDRMKDSQVPWIVHRYPLIYEVPKSRRDCVRWMLEHSYPEPPRSACIWCPFRSDEQWRMLTAEEFADSVQFERDLQAAYRQASGLNAVPYLHSSRLPLDQVPFDAQLSLDLNQFRNECEGMCGV